MTNVCEAWSLASPSASAAAEQADDGAGCRFGEGDLVAGRYRVLEVLGTGGQGTAHAALDERTGEAVVVKSPRRDRSSGRIAREAEALRLVDDPRVVALVGHDAGLEPPVIVMEYVGPTLSDLVRAMPDGRLELGLLSAIAVDLVGAVEACHRAGLVHRDIKPSNVALWGEGLSRAKLIDLGLAKGVPARPAARSGRFVGTVRYASARSLEGGPHAPIDDGWGLLYTLIHCAVGGLPWRRSDTRETVLERKRRFLGRELCAGLPACFERARSAVAASPDGEVPFESLRDAFGSVPGGPSLSPRPLEWDPTHWEVGRLREAFRSASAWRRGTGPTGPG